MVTMIIVKPSEKLKVLRTRRHWTQEELAEKIRENGPKVYQGTVSRYETDKEEPDSVVKETIQNIFGEEIWSDECNSEVSIGVIYNDAEQQR